MAINTSKGYPYPEDTDAADVPSDVQALAEAVDASPGIASLSQAQIDALSAGQRWAGRIVWNQTANKLQRSDGSTWTDVVVSGGGPYVIAANSSSDALRVTQTGAGNALLVEDSANPDATPFVVDASGNVGIGTSNPTQPLHASGTSFGAIVDRYATASTSGPGISFRRSNNATAGAQGIVASGDYLGRIIFSGSDGTNFIDAAQIRATVNGNPGTNDMPGSLIFETTADGASTPTERMRITSAGNVGIGTSNPGAVLHIERDAASTVPLAVKGASGQTARLLEVGTHTDVKFLLTAAGDTRLRSGQTLGLLEATNNNTWTLQNDANNLEFAYNGTEYMRINNAGLITGTGTSLGAWTAYTPTLSGTGWAIGNGTATGVFCQLGKTVIGHMTITFGSTSTYGSTDATFSLPVTARSSVRSVTGNARLVDASAGASYIASPYLTGTTTVALFYPGANGAYSGIRATSPFAWASSDVINIDFVYEAA